MSNFMLHIFYYNKKAFSKKKKNIEYNPLCYAVGLCLSISIYNGLR